MTEERGRWKIYNGRKRRVGGERCIYNGERRRLGARGRGGTEVNMREKRNSGQT